MPENFTAVWNRLLLRAPGVGASLARDIVADSVLQFCERRDWSWMVKSSAIAPNAIYNTGVVTTVQNSPVVTGLGTTFTPDMAGRQFRATTVTPTYTIVQFVSATQLILDRPWAGTALTGSTYTIFDCYFTVPADFARFQSLLNPASNIRITTNITQIELDLWDRQRTRNGPVWVASHLDYGTVCSGEVRPAFQAYGSGAALVATTSYGFSYPADSLYTVRITTSGAPGGALDFAWRQDSGSWTTAVPVPDNSAIDLSNGVQVYFPTGSYVAGDVFIIDCRYGVTTSAPRYELWPRPIGYLMAYPFTYIRRLDRPSDESPVLPPILAARGDVLLEIALAKAAQYPGASMEDAKITTPYFSLQLAAQHNARAEAMIQELEMKDDEIAERMLSYQQQYGNAPIPFMDASYRQGYDPEPA